MSSIRQLFVTPIVFMVLICSFVGLPHIPLHAMEHCPLLELGTRRIWTEFQGVCFDRMGRGEDLIVNGLCAMKKDDAQVSALVGSERSKGFSCLGSLCR